MSGYICPVCRAPRELELSDRIPPIRHLQIALVVTLIAGTLYRLGGTEIGLRAVFFYLPLWAGCEFVHWTKMREAAKCKVCDFDPILYRKSPLEARRVVEKKLNIYVEELKGRLQQKSPSYKKSQSAGAPPSEPTAPTPEAAASKI